jgi:hypothetical protein
MSNRNGFLLFWASWCSYNNPFDVLEILNVDKGC